MILWLLFSTAVGAGVSSAVQISSDITSAAPSPALSVSTRSDHPDESMFLSPFVMSFIDDGVDGQWLADDQRKFWEETTATHILDFVGESGGGEDGGGIAEGSVTRLRVQVNFLEEEDRVIGGGGENGAENDVQRAYRFNVYVTYFLPSANPGRNITLLAAPTETDFRDAVVGAFASQSLAGAYLQDLRDADDARARAFLGIRAPLAVTFRGDNSGDGGSSETRPDETNSFPGYIIAVAVIAPIGVSLLAILVSKLRAKVIDRRKGFESPGAPRVPFGDESSSGTFTWGTHHRDDGSTRSDGLGQLSTGSGIYNFGSVATSTIDPSITSSEADQKVMRAVAAAAARSSSGLTFVSDESSFEKYRQREEERLTTDARLSASGSLSHRGEVVEVIAPHGRLGLSIDTPDGPERNCGAPFVREVGSGSPLAGVVEPGDHLLAVDDEDVRRMTALQVSKVISKKNWKPNRRLMILRRHSSNDGGL
mmetsp:Transcript_5918/g.12376  ORF Transcript_5918/g.12376 Transcript_5918/m.12376 type:complete len:481 (-) Transcript_5918:141-1583(-)